VKVRLARDVARDFGWEPRVIVPALVVSEASTSRRRIAAHEALFSRFDVRGWQARRWLTAPDASSTGLLLFVNLALDMADARRRPGRQRVRATG